jgi:hypothetical protein
MTPPAHDPTKPHTDNAWTLGCPRCDADYRRYMELAADPLDVVDWDWDWDWDLPQPSGGIPLAFFIVFAFMSVLLVGIVAWAGR